ncbi:hypothetical protein CPB86DRAFT_753904 [Serendipita vermifera]|nr:hypothetical protein CPB86DRAFT_753904 [Serendipita vermifera]
MFPATPTQLTNFLIQANPAIAPLFQQDVVRGKAVLLKMLAELFVRKGAPLPPALTGYPTPSWNPVTSHFKFELGADKGVVKIAGQEIELFKIWHVLYTHGLYSKVAREGTWAQVTAQLGLPPTLEDGITQTSTQVQAVCGILGEVETFLYKLMQNQRMQIQQRQLQQQQALFGGSQPGAHMSGYPPTVGGGAAAADTSGGHTGVSQGTPSLSGSNTSNTNPPASAHTPTTGGAGGPSTPAQHSDDSDSRKRKAEMDEDDEAKKAKIRRIDEDGNPTTSTESEPRATPVKEEAQPEGPLLRRKIQYVPVMRTIATYGGRDMDNIEHEYRHIPQRRPMKRMEDFGIVDVESLILQLRSRLRVEMATALGLLYHLAWLRGGTGNQGLQLSLCEDLTDELLDLLEETAFGGVPDVDEPEDARLDTRIITNRELTRMIQDEGSELFAGVKADKQLGHISPTHQPWEVVAMIITILASVSSADENPAYLASRPKLLDIVTRICMTQPQSSRDELPKPLSGVLQVRHLLRIRKDVVSMVAVIAKYVRLNDNPPRTTKRLYLLFAATMMDSDECIPPGTVGRTPGAVMDLALDAFTQVAQPDYNRKVISEQIPWEKLWELMLMLTRILPFTDADIQNVVSEMWMSFVFKAALALYSLAVAAPMPMRQKMKSSPALRGCLTRFLRMGTTMNTPQNTMHRGLPHEVRATVEEYWKRIGETLRVIDGEEDPLAPTSAAGGLIGYGLGGSYDLHLGAKPPARGTGMFAGSRADLLWSIMSTSAVQNDGQAFEEWDYMLRVDSSTASRV